MEPSILSDGKQENLVQGGLSYREASMEPSTFIDGKPWLPWSSRRWLLSFNGAVDVHRRKGTSSVRRKFSGCGFNGAVDVHRRKAVQWLSN